MQFQHTIEILEECREAVRGERDRLRQFEDDLEALLESNDYDSAAVALDAAISALRGDEA